MSERNVIKMKNKLLALISAFAVICCLFIPAFSVSAAVPTAKLSLGTPTITDYNGEKVIALDVNLTENTGKFFTAAYRVKALDGVKPYYKSGAEGFGNGTFSDNGLTINTTVINSENGNLLDFSGFQIVQDVNGNDGNGITVAGGKLITLYFAIPDVVNTHSFELEWIGGTDNKIKLYNTTVSFENAFFDYNSNFYTDDFDNTVIDSLVSGRTIKNMIDANSDDISDIRDIVRLKKELAKSTLNDDFDITGNAKLDSEDLTFAREYLLFGLGK